MEGNLGVGWGYEPSGMSCGMELPTRRQKWGLGPSDGNLFAGTYWEGEEDWKLEPSRGEGGTLCNGNFRSAFASSRI